MCVLIKNSYSSLQYLARSVLWMELLNLLKVLKSVDAGSSFHTLTIRTEKKIFSNVGITAGTVVYNSVL